MTIQYDGEPLSAKTSPALANPFRFKSPSPSKFAHKMDHMLLCGCYRPISANKNVCKFRRRWRFSTNLWINDDFLPGNSKPRRHCISVVLPFRFQSDGCRFPSTESNI